LQDVTVTLDYN